MGKTKRSADWNYGGPRFKLSRSKIDLFTDCKKCFYLDNKLGVARPKMPSFTLNLAVDALLKKEFDTHRKKQSKHPLMEKYKINAIPYEHKDIDLWRENFVGIHFLHKETGLTISGAIDDVWVDPKGNLIIVDYKATSKDGTIDALEDTKWHDQYKKQMEVYQWLFRKNGHMVSDTGYFVYVNGRKDEEAFDGKLEFDITLIPYKGDTAWVEKIILEIKKCLESTNVPNSSDDCEFCNYRKLARDVFEESVKKTNKNKKKDIPNYKHIATNNDTLFG